MRDYIKKTCRVSIAAFLHPHPDFRDGSSRILTGPPKALDGKHFQACCETTGTFPRRRPNCAKPFLSIITTMKTRFALRSDNALASALVASALPNFRARCRDPAQTLHFCRPSQKQAESTGVYGPQMQYLPKRGVFAKIWIPPKGDFRTTNGFWAGYNAVSPPERGGCGYKKDLHDQDNHNGVITHLEPDIWNVKSSGP